MKEQHAYSVCDMMEFLLEKDCIVPSFADMVYLGSYFCDVYFCNVDLDLWRRCFDKVRELGKRVVLVIPTPSQSQLLAVKTLVTQLMKEFAEDVDEIVLNDYAMIAFAEQYFPDKKRWAGRMLSKETRDPRYPAKEQAAKTYERAVKRDIFGFDVAGVEVDPVAPINVITGAQCMLGVHTPYAYISMGRICEFGSIGLQLADKFRLFNACKFQCRQNWLLYESCGCQFVKHGKAIFTPNEDAATRCQHANSRMIHSALKYKLSKD